MHRSSPAAERARPAVQSLLGLRCLPRDAVSADPVLVARLRNLLDGMYENPCAVLDRALGGATDVYIARTDAEVAGFLLVTHGRCVLDTGPAPSTYLGLGVVARPFRGRRILLRLLEAVARDLRDRERAEGEAPVIWALTAVTGIPRLLEHVFDRVEPSPDGSHSPRTRAVAELARQKLGLTAAAGDHPLVLRGAVPTRYTPMEKALLPECDRYAGLFRSLDVDETSGDRLVLSLSIGVER